MATYNDKGYPQSVNEVLKFQNGLKMRSVNDLTGSEYYYFGWTPEGAGTATSDTNWLIQRVGVSGTFTGNTGWASGTNGPNVMDKEWDERTSYTYEY